MEDDTIPVATLMECISVGSKSIASFPDRVTYPSTQYIMHQLPVALRKHFPQDLVSGEQVQYEDRVTELEIQYRPARTLEEWRNHVAAFDEDHRVHDELPWYRPGY